MNAALVDDLESDLRILENLLKEYFSLQGLEFQGSFFLSGEQFLSAFCPGRFDMIFMDNLMDGINGMETARRLRRLDGTIPIIFVTTEESYALEGYSVRAADYLLKPVSKERLFASMDHLTEAGKRRKSLEIQENRIIRQLYLDEVLYVRSAGHFLEILTVSGALRPYMTLESFLSMLQQLGEYGDPSLGLRFQNCCRGYVVCLDHVCSFNPMEFIMTDGSRVPISRPRYKEMKNAYAGYLFRQTRNLAD